MTYKAILRMVARQSNSTPAAVEAAIKEAIDAAYANPAPEVKKEQAKISCKGNVPTPEEFIRGVARLVHTTESQSAGPKRWA